MTAYPHLFTPLTIRGKTIPNRIVSTPHATGWELPGGLISDKEVDYLVRKAAGGVGLVMTFGSATVDPTTAASYGSIALWNAQNEPQLRRIAEGVHAHGGLVISQTTQLPGQPHLVVAARKRGVHLTGQAWRERQRGRPGSVDECELRDERDRTPAATIAWAT
jgi:2,4-dienoyl-CoA reductase-like NADH-dependent reductase (Old Yellow Enzyme family)